VHTVRIDMRACVAGGGKCEGAVCKLILCSAVRAAVSAALLALKNGTCSYSIQIALVFLSIHFSEGEAIHRGGPSIEFRHFRAAKGSEARLSLSFSFACTTPGVRSCARSGMPFSVHELARVG
jgi:hypothetical protein